MRDIGSRAHTPHDSLTGVRRMAVDIKPVLVHVEYAMLFGVSLRRPRSKKVNWQCLIGEEYDSAITE